MMKTCQRRPCGSSSQFKGRTIAKKIANVTVGKSTRRAAYGCHRMHERYLVTNGIRLFCFESGPSDGPLVLLFHGFPELAFSWRHQVDALGAAGYHVVAPDLPGYGRSDKPDVTYDCEWINACLVGLVPALGHERAVIAGHDWGGLLVWPMARRYPDRVAGVIGVNTPDLPRSPMPPVQL